ncbi:hypothetical protein KIN20_038466 [Parelaphostrongylus tenuis]|uniref:Uncharacterized protein n=1 Tax=Parelaphostrongylus tenuis TaxID=148309 RepID=A0AAD5RDL1_PARTN|nr:hypothetical protein KIN20_038466 [Parelaphostrongylus tenuis]
MVKILDLIPIASAPHQRVPFLFIQWLLTSRCIICPVVTSLIFASGFQILSWIHVMRFTQRSSNFLSKETLPFDLMELQEKLSHRLFSCTACVSNTGHNGVFSSRISPAKRASCFACFVDKLRVVDVQ